MSDCAGQVHDWEPHGLLQLTALDFTFATHFGKDFNFLSPLDTNGAADREYTLGAFQDFLTGFDFILKHQALGPLLQNRYPNKLSQKVAKFYSSVAKVETSAREIIEQRKKELSEGAEPKCTVLDKLIAEKRLHLTWNLITFTLSGGTSVPSNIEWFLYLMCINQDAQKKARAEVDALGKDPTDNDDLDKLRYVEACVLETLR
ncbi:cytochrome p450, putative, partial [Perkinsus marinus ATCC 50983]